MAVQRGPGCALCMSGHKPPPLKLACAHWIEVVAVYSCLDKIAFISWHTSTIDWYKVLLRFAPSCPNRLYVVRMHCIVLLALITGIRYCSLFISISPSISAYTVLTTFLRCHCIVRVMRHLSTTYDLIMMPYLVVVLSCACSYAVIVWFFCLLVAISLLFSAYKK